MCVIEVRSLRASASASCISRGAFSAAAVTLISIASDIGLAPRTGSGQHDRLYRVFDRDLECSVHGELMHGAAEVLKRVNQAVGRHVVGL